MAVTEVPVYCAHCGVAAKLFFATALAAKSIPKRVPIFCSEKCAREFLRKDELAEIGGQ